MMTAGLMKEKPMQPNLQNLLLHYSVEGIASYPLRLVIDSNGQISQNLFENIE